MQQENEDLKESLKEHQSVLEYIMAKYREQMLKLIQLKREQEMSENFYKSILTKVKFGFILLVLNFSSWFKTFQDVARENRSNR